MQYKQAPRILLEIAEDKKTSAKLKLVVIELLMRLTLMPKLGPYPKRSTEQVLWRVASNSKLGPRERWAAVRTLLAAAVGEQWAKEGTQAPPPGAVPLS